MRAGARDTKVDFVWSPDIGCVVRRQNRFAERDETIGTLVNQQRTDRGRVPVYYVRCRVNDKCGGDRAKSDDCDASRFCLKTHNGGQASPVEAGLLDLVAHGEVHLVGSDIEHQASSAGNTGDQILRVASIQVRASNTVAGTVIYPVDFARREIQFDFLR